MKRIAVILSALAVFAGCSKLSEIEQPESVISGNDLPDVLYASVSDDETDPQTRTYVDGKKVLWHGGDAISYYAGTKGNVKYVYNGEDGASAAEFAMSGSPQYTYGYGQYYGYDIEPEFSLGIYPYYEDQMATYLDGTYYVRATYPDVQTYFPNSYGKDANLMYAIGRDSQDKELYFHNACGYLVIKLYGINTRVKSIKLSALDPQVNIAGGVILTVKQSSNPEELDISKPTSNSVILDCSNGGEGVTVGHDADNATEFWFALPPITIEGGIKVEITDVYERVYTKQTSKDVTIVRNCVQPMAAFYLDLDRPAGNQIWYTRRTESTEPIPFNYYNIEAGKTPFARYEGENQVDVAVTAHYYDETNKRFVIQLASDVTVIKDDAFRYNPNWSYERQDYKSIILPNTVKRIGDSAFSYSGMEEFTIPGSVDYIETDAFQVCNLKRLVIEPSPNGTTLVTGCVVGDYNDHVGSFHSLDLEYLYMNRKVTMEEYFGDSFTPDDVLEGLFSYALSTGAEVIIGPNVTEIDDYMFSKNPGLAAITIPDHITKIGKGAFAETGITSITVPGSVHQIGDYAFDDCTSLSTVRFESSSNPLYLGYQDYIISDKGPFYDSPLKNIYLDRAIVYGNDDLDATDEGIFSNKYSADADWTTEVVLGSNLQTISDYMFYNLTIYEIEIPRNVTSIGKLAFGNCESLYEVTMRPTNPPVLAVDAFSGCTLLKHITVPGEESLSKYIAADNWKTLYDSRDVYFSVNW